MAFSYWQESSRCDVIVIKKDLGIVYVTYTIERVSSDGTAVDQNVTHGHKGPYNGKYWCCLMPVKNGLTC